MLNLLANKPSFTYYNILSIGQRGVGKTVFFMGNYVSSTEKLSLPQKNIWFDCVDEETQQTIEKVRQYVAKMGEYPPATMRITNFDFYVKQRKRWREQILCQVCWWDPPGESCQIYNPAFLTMATTCDACCLFLDANDLVQHANDATAIAQRLAPITNLTEILHYNKLDRPLALILTKCDLLADSVCRWQTLKQILTPLTHRLDKLGIPYQPFYSRVPILREQQTPVLQGSYQEKPLLWLLTQLQNEKKSETLTKKTNNEHFFARIWDKNPIGMRSLYLKTHSLILSSKAFFLLLIALTSIVGMISTVAINQAMNSQPNAFPTKLNSI